MDVLYGIRCDWLSHVSNWFRQLKFSVSRMTLRLMETFLVFQLEKK